MLHNIEFTFPPRKKQKMDKNYTILFHGNCIDGWFSAFIAHSVLKNNGYVHMYPISPSQTNTWPSILQITGSNILLLDVSVPQHYRDMWMKGGAFSIKCIDHHQTSIEHWPVDACPIQTESCAALQTWQYFYPNMEIPIWLHHIDRVDRWDNPTYEDRCIREVLNEIAHKPVQKLFDEAFSMTDQFLMNMSNPIGTSAIIQYGKDILEKKDAELLSILTDGAIYTFDQDYISHWQLPNTWLDKRVFIIDNTGITLDTTEAAHLVFELHNVDVFINYRRKNITYTYSARSREFNISEGTVLKGHPTSAGATLIRGQVPVLPFLLHDPWKIH